MSNQTISTADALHEYVEAELAAALMEAGRRPDPSNRTAAVLAPRVVALLADPLCIEASARSST